MEQTNWPAIVGVAVTLTVTIVGASTAYLTLFINNKLNAHEKAILNHIDEKFALKELMEEKFKRVEDRLTSIERK